MWPGLAGWGMTEMTVVDNWICSHNPYLLAYSSRYLTYLSVVRKSGSVAESLKSEKAVRYLEETSYARV